MAHRVGTGQHSSHSVSRREHQHQALYPDREEFRLLELNPGDFSAPLSCQIRIASLQEDSLQYEALSYTWALQDGDSSFSSAISIEPSNSLVKISASCENALRKVRHSTQKKTLWVDMICIDQSNISERNHHVAQMKAIFSKSRRVLVDVGDDPGGVEVFEYLSINPKEYGRKYNRQTPRSGAFSSLFSLRWFYRVWVLQEVTLAKEAVVFCGNVCIAWSWIYRFLDGYIHEPTMSSSLTNSSLVKMRPPACNVYMLLRNEDDSDLLDLLVSSRPCQCSDERDKVYALFGLLHHSQIPFAPDYSKKYEELYTNTAVWIIQRTKNLQILNHIQPEGNSRLPTWVPDWSCPPYESWEGLPGIESAQEPYEVRFDNTFHVGNPWSISPLPGTTKNRRTVEQPFSPPTVKYAIGNNLTLPTLTAFARKIAVIWVGNSVEQDDWRRIIHHNYRGRNAYFNEALSQQFWRNFPVFRSFEKMPIPLVLHYDISRSLRLRPKEEPSIPWEAHKISRLLGDAALYSNHLRGFLTVSSLGFGPETMQDGDCIWRIAGAEKLFILRQHNHTYRIVGPCYFVDGRFEPIEVKDHDSDSDDEIETSPWEEIEIT